MSRTFIRWVPFADGREVIVRRGDEMGCDYGLELSRHTVRRQTLVRYRALLSPPPLAPGQPPLAPTAAARYQPEHDILRLADQELLIPRAPDGFSDDEVDAIVRACLEGETPR
jgi:hypothetical protein